MKNLKKIASLVLALVMVFALAVDASAYSISLHTEGNASVTGHTYNVYQIFTGTLDGTTLTDIVYGENFGTKDVTVPKAYLDAITDAADARAYAQSLVDDGLIIGDPIAVLNEGNNWTANTITIEGDDPATEETEDSYKVDIPAGYYLIMDVTDEIPENDSKSAYIVEVVQNVDIKPKSEKTTSGKEINTDDYLANADTNIKDGTYNNVAIGTTIQFEVNAKVPSNAVDYDNYFLVLNDTLSKGLEFDADSVKVYLSNDKDYSPDDVELAVDTNYKLFDNTNTATDDDADDASLTFQVSILNANQKDDPNVNNEIVMAGKYIVVVYEATVTPDAEILPSGMPNDFYPVVSRDPEYNYDGNDDDNDGRPDSYTDIPVGEGPHDKTWTYTTGLKIMKVDDQGNALKGAEFQLEGETTKITLVSTESFEEDENGTYYQLTNGAYTEEAPRTADKMVPKGDDEDKTKGYVKIDTEREGSINIDGELYAPILDTEVGTVTEVYTLLKANSSAYKNDGKMYSKTVELTQQSDTATADIKAVVGDDGYLYFLGLGEGTYTIKETVTPDGYNTIDDITVVIDWDAPAATATNSNCTWTATADGKTITADTETLVDEDGNTRQVAVFQLEIENVPGSNLPETGGMGTTLFYVFGGIMVVAAVVLLVTKKRMSVVE